MKTLQSLEELRKYTLCDEYGRLMAYTKADELADEIQAEVDSRFIELPVDADGVPIHVGDVLECNANGYEGTFTVFAIGNDTVVGNHDIEWIRDNPSKWFHVASFCHHVKPDPLKELLSELANEVWEASCTCQTTWSDSGLDGIEERYANRIRELMKEGGE